MEQYTYKTKEERLGNIAEAEAKGLVLLHDDLTKDGGILTFDSPKPPTAEELAEKVAQKEIEKANDMINSISNLVDAKVFLKKLCARLFKNGSLP